MQVLKDYADMCAELNSTNAKNEKVEILKKWPQCQRLINYTLDSFKVYGVTSKNVIKQADKFTVNKNKDELGDVFVLFDKLAVRELSGHAAIQEIVNWIGHYPEYKDIILNVLDKDMKTRTSASSINNAYPGLVPVFDICRANVYDDKAKKRVDDSWFIQRKLNGVRAVAIWQGGELKFYSRSGKEYLTLQKIAEPLKAMLSDEFGNDAVVVDGEICLFQDDGVESLRKLMKEVTKKNHTVENPKYVVYDILTYDEFTSGKGSIAYEQRYKDLLNTFVYKRKHELIEVVEMVDYNEDNFQMMMGKVVECGWEGLILRENVGYVGKKCKHVLKVKEFFDDEYTVVRCESGPFRAINKETGLEETIETLTNVIVVHKGTEVSVGSGFTLAERKLYYDKPELLKGNKITVKYKQETENEKGTTSLEFPVFICLHGKKREL